MAKGLFFVSGGGGGGGIQLYSKGVLLGTITGLDIEGNELLASIAGSLGILNSLAGTFGYFSGGFAGGFQNITDGLEFSNDTAAMIAKGVLLNSVTNLCAYNSAKFGYFTGGSEGPGNTVTSAISKLDFSNDTAAMAGGTAFLIAARTGLAGFNSSLVGYASGGNTSNVGSVLTANTDGLLFSNDVAAQIAKGVLTVAKSSLAACNSSTFGYVAGGNSGITNVTDCDALDFSNDTNAMVAKGILTGLFDALAGANSTTFGYFSGGDNNLGNPVTTTNRLDFSNDAAAMVAKGALSVARALLAGCNSNTTAYFAGGTNNVPALFATCDGLSFSNDAAAMTTKGALTLARRGLASCQGGGIL